MIRFLKGLLIISLLIFSTSLSAQDTSKKSDSPWRLQFYSEAYFGTSSQGVRDKEREYYFNFSRDQQFAINLASLRGAWQRKSFRASVSVGAGTYMQRNYAAEPEFWQYVPELQAGVNLLKAGAENASLWLDAGIFSSHLGFESAQGNLNPTLTRSLVAENSPYYESGAKLTYTNKRKDWMLSALYLRGWQRIRIVEGNTLPSFGTQVQWIPSDKNLFNWSSFVGTDDPDSTRRMRLFNNFYWLGKVTDRLSVTAGVDYGLQQSSKGSDKWNSWWGPVVIAGYSFSSQWNAAFRAEYYSDGSGVIVPVPHANGYPFETSGFSANVDYKPWKFLAARIEGKYWMANNEIFTDHKDAFYFTASLCLSLDSQMMNWK